MSGRAVTPQETVERALALSKADGCIVLADEDSHADLRWAGNTLTTNGVTRSRRLTVIATVDGAQGTAAGVVSRSGIEPDDLEDLVRAAERAATDAGPAEDARPLVGPDAAPAGAGDGWDAPPDATSAAVFDGVGPALGEAFRAAAGDGRLLYGFASHDVGTTYLGSSTGLRLRHDQPSGTFELNAKSSDLSRSAWVGTSTRDFTDLDVPALDADLVTRLGWAERRIELPAGRYDTVLPPSAVGDLLVYLYWTASAREAHEGQTPFAKPGGGTRIGERLGPDGLTLRSDPGAPGLECSPFVVAHGSGSVTSVFDNGLPSGPVAWIDDGRLGALLQSRYTADLTGLPLTPPVGNLVLETSTPAGSMADLVSRTERGLLLTCLWYIRVVDPQTLLLTGLTRDGVYVVEGGEIVGATTNFRFNESPVSLLGRAAEITPTEPTLPREFGDYFTRAAMPAIRVPDFNMSTVSDAS